MRIEHHFSSRKRNVVQPTEYYHGNAAERNSNWHKAKFQHLLTRTCSRAWRTCSLVELLKKQTEYVHLGSVGHKFVVRCHVLTQIVDLAGDRFHRRHPLLFQFLGLFSEKKMFPYVQTRVTQTQLEWQEPGERATIKCTIDRYKDSIQKNHHFYWRTDKTCTQS